MYPTFLNEFGDIFAFLYDDIFGIDPTFVMHNLLAHKNAKLIQ